MKKLTLIIKMILIGSSLIFSIDASTDLPVLMSEKWKKLSDQEQWNQVRELYRLSQSNMKLYEDAETRCNILIVDNAKLIKDLEAKQKEVDELETNLEKEKNKKEKVPVCGIDSNLGVILHSDFSIALLILVNFKYYPVKWFYIGGGAYLTPYNKVGGGINFNFGFVLYK